jgi:1-acyl-sn-glycerol-3-phosphate acyltransferase
MKSIELASRFLASALLWFFFGLIGLILSVFVFPILYLTIQKDNGRQHAARRLVALAFSTFMWGGYRMGVFTVHLTGMRHKDPDGAQLILANHPTLIDVVLLLSLLPQVDCVIKEAVRKNIFMRSSVTTANYISNQEPEWLLDSCVSCLESGSSLLMFPEGTRTTVGQGLHFKLGAAEVAMRARAQILPIVIDCTPHFLTRGAPWYSIPLTRPHFAVRILPAIPVEQLISGGLDKRDARNQLNNALVSLFESELT